MNEFTGRSITLRLQAKSLRAGPWATGDGRDRAMLEASGLERQACVEDAKSELLLRWREDFSGSPALFERHRQVRAQNERVQRTIAQADRLAKAAKIVRTAWQATLGRATAVETQRAQAQAIIDRLATDGHAILEGIDAMSRLQRWRQADAIKAQRALLGEQANRTKNLVVLVQDFQDLRARARAESQALDAQHTRAQQAAQAAVHNIERERRSQLHQKGLLSLAEHQQAQQHWDSFDVREQQRRLDAMSARRAAMTAVSTTAIPSHGPPLERLLRASVTSPAASLPQASPSPHDVRIGIGLGR